MVKKAIRLIFLFIIVGLALYIVTFNGAPTTVYLSGTKSFQASTGVVLISTFALGILVSSIIAGFFAIKGYFRERHLIWKDRQAQDFFDQFADARGISAIGKTDKAQAAWENLIKSDPTSTIARIELARLLLAQGSSKEALRILDQARSHDPNNLEILKLAIDLNLSLGNKTAALDNASLLVSKQPSKEIASIARDLAEELGRPDEALQFHETLYSLGAKDATYNDTKTRLEFELLLKRIDRSNIDEFRKAIQGFLKKNKNYPAALAVMAELEQEKNNPKQAAQLLADAARSSGDSEYWYRAAKLWLKNNMPDSALSAARTAVNESKGIQKIYAELDLIRLQIALSRLKEANESLENLTKSARDSVPAISPELSQTILILKALCLTRMGSPKEAGVILTQLSKFEFSLPEAVLEIAHTPHAAPSPQLSTP